MHKFFQIFIFVLLANIFGLNAHASEMYNIYVSATGNNQFEAKVKADAAGMKRCALMLLRKFGIQSDKHVDFAYDDLARVFEQTKVLNEQINEKSYSATVDYSYDKHELGQFMFHYFPQESEEKFARYLVFPVFKQGNKVVLWQDKNQQWLALWDKHSSDLANSKLIVGSRKEELKRNINANNIFTITYSDLLKLLPESLFEKALIVTLEYFTYDNGQGYIQIDYTTLSHDGKSVITETLPIASQSEISAKMEYILDKVRKDYGSDIIIATQQPDSAEKTGIIDDRPAYVMQARIYNPEELNELRHKLHNIANITKVNIVHDYDTKYRVDIYTSLASEELAKEFFKNNLSYIRNGDSYLLISIKHGV